LGRGGGDGPDKTGDGDGAAKYSDDHAHLQAGGLTFGPGSGFRTCASLCHAMSRRADCLSHVSAGAKFEEGVKVVIVHD
jgi:hypothetical protein